MNGECVSKRSEKNCCTMDRLYGLTMFLVVCLLLSLGCLAVVSYFAFVNPKSKDDSYCTDPLCIQAAAEIHEFIDDRIDPCGDFHAFICDKFMKTAYEKQLSDPLSAEQNRVETKIDKYIIEPDSRNDEQPVLMQKRYFQACRDEEDIDRNNNTDFLSLLNEIGGWPILKNDDWREQDFDWMRAMVRARQLGLPFEWFLDIDIYDSGNYYLLKISRPKNCEDFKHSSSDKYIILIAHIISGLIGPTASIKNVEEIVNFEKKLSEICVQTQNEIVVNAQIHSLEQDKNRIWPGNMTCRKFINDISAQTRNWQFNSEVVYEREYMHKLRKLLTQTDKEIQANYIGWKITQYFAPYLSKSIREAYQNYQNEYSDRFQFCLTDTKSRFPLVSETMYIRENTNTEIVEAGIELVSSIKSELVDKIKHIQWMSNDTKQTHLNFFEKMDITIGGPDIIFEEDFFLKYLDVGQLSFSSYNIIRMLCDWSKTKFLTKMTHIGKPSTLPFNSDYIESTKLIFDEEGIYIPAQLLRGSTFDIERPYYLNYGSLGTLIAAKLVEGIIPTKPVSDHYYQNYIRHQQCLVKASKTVIHDNNLPLYVVEYNFVDLLSRHLAYNAYQKYVEEHGEELELAGLNYTPNQLFWIKSTTNLCYKKLPNDNDDDDLASLMEEMQKNSILQSVKNSPFFGEDFECDADAPMNPSDKCTIFEN